MEDYTFNQYFIFNEKKIVYHIRSNLKIELGDNKEKENPNPQDTKVKEKKGSKYHF